jgi:hypothetical protein
MQSIQVPEAISDMLFTSAQANDVHSYKREAYSAYQHVFGDMVKYFPVNITRLFVSPTFRHKVFNYEALVTDSSGNSFATLKYLFNKYPIFHVRNTSFIGTDYTVNVSRKNPINFIAPNYTGTLFSELPNTQKLLVELQKCNYINASSSDGWVGEVLHYSGHISAASGVSNLSCFCIGNSKLTVAELMKENTVKLALVQGCQSASGRHMINMSQEGISKQLFNQGVNTVLSTVWPIDDGASSLIMLDLYKNLPNTDVAHALKIAKQNVFNQGYHNPIYWLGMYYEGAPVTVAIEENYNLFNWFMVSISILIVVLLFRYIVK